MMKPFLSLFIFLITAQFTLAQENELIVKNGDNGLYLVHKVVPKESFYSVSRLYNVSPKYIAAFNKLDINKGLFIDQKIRIPLTDTNFTQKGNSGTPVYFKADDEKDLAKISSVNNNVSVENLKVWNNFSGSIVKKDSKLIIGFLLSKGMPSVTISGKAKPVEPVIKVEEKPVETNTITEGKKPEIKEEVKKPEPVIKEAVMNGSSGEGYFKLSFEQQAKTNPVSKNETVTAGIFKTTSGWTDAKYYL
ncbi:MAG TPA: LysM peptidoglycan-binding domain-containing protein, partial [Chitinophagaceae bacterium]|nr:LysM peptidoglycan-binding domain-containing protein [Chitinophagaceae bacterium]